MRGVFKSFVDVLFILLLGTLVMLTQSVRLGALDTALARAGAQGTSAVRADEVQVVVVAEDAVFHEQRPWSDPAALAAHLGQGRPVLLITSDRDVRHHRVLEVWLALRDRGLDVKLGVEPSPPRREQ
jgi:biopolymer transport protein ExbD